MLLHVYQLQKEDEDNCSLLLNILSDLVTKDRKRPRYLIPFLPQSLIVSPSSRLSSLVRLVRKSAVMEINQVRELLNKKDRSV